MNDTSQEVLLLNFMTLIKKKLGRFAVHNISQLGLWEVGLPRADCGDRVQLNALFQMQKTPCCAKSLEADAVQEHIRGGFHPSKHVEAWNGVQLRTEHCCDCGAALQVRWTAGLPSECYEGAFSSTSDNSVITKAVSCYFMLFHAISMLCDAVCFLPWQQNRLEPFQGTPRASLAATLSRG